MYLSVGHISINGIIGSLTGSLFSRLPEGLQVTKIITFYGLPWSRQQYLLQDINAEQPRPGDDAALSCAVSSKDEIGWSEQLGLSQTTFSFLVAGEGKNKNINIVSQKPIHQRNYNAL